MGVYTTIYKDNREVATLWATHNYLSDFESVEELTLKMLGVVLEYVKTDCRDHASASEATDNLSEMIEYVIGETIRYGRKDVIDTLKENDGVEVRHG